ncbi:hypothetical protein BC360_02700 [Ensifer sp. LC163]|nr:hypothetical protein BC360_02700 [Ensifer sp. LC163]
MRRSWSFYVKRVAALRRPEAVLTPIASFIDCLVAVATKLHVKAEIRRPLNGKDLPSEQVKITQQTAS